MCFFQFQVFHCIDVPYVCGLLYCVAGLLSFLILHGITTSIACSETGVSHHKIRFVHLSKETYRKCRYTVPSLAYPARMASIYL